MSATTGELYKSIQDVEAWIERATEEADAEATRGEDDYETERAFAWLVTLESRRERLIGRLDQVIGENPHPPIHLDRNDHVRHA